jgi:hypothetical protein
MIIFFSFQVWLNFLIKAYLFLRFKNILKKIKKNYYKLIFFDIYVLFFNIYIWVNNNFISNVKTI